MQDLLTAFYYIVLYLAVFSGTYFLTSRLTRRFYRKSWMNMGREDRALRYPYHFTSNYSWIQKYYDEGYYEQDRRGKNSRG